MVMPSLACAMPACVNEVKGENHIIAHCAGHHKESQSKKGQSDGVRFVLDCMGVDLQKADVVAFENAHIQINLLDHLFFGDTVTAQNLYKIGTIIRGPPPDFAEYSYPTQSIILTTQRLRI